MKSMAEKILGRFKRIPQGEPLCVQEFLGYGPRTAVDQALSRLVKSGILSRPVRGVYVRPRKNQFVGEVAPASFKVARAIAKQSNNQVLVHGAEAARRFGFSTQVQAKSVFETSGPTRRRKMGNTELFIKRVAQRKTLLAGRPSGEALRALYYLGKKRVTTETIKQIHQKLSAGEFALLESKIATMPGWMQTVFRAYDTGKGHD